MEKKKAILKIALISLLAALLVVFSIISFMPANSVKGFAGFAGSISKGFDLEGGIYANYAPSKIGEMTDEEFNDAVKSTFDRVDSLIEQKGYQDAKVYLTSDNQIRVETPNASDAEKILSLIGSGELKFRTSSSSTADVVLTGSGVTSAFAMQDPSTYYWGTYIGFTEEGGAKLAEITKNATESSPKTLYFYRGDSTSAFFSLQITSQVTNNFLFISTSTGEFTQNNAVDLAIQISTGSYDVVLETADSSTMSASAGKDAVLGLIIAGSVLALATIIIFAVVYRELGLMAIISILLFIGATLFFMQAIPVISLSVSSLGAVVAGLVLISGCHFVLLEKIRSEYKKGKKLNASVKSGFKNSIAIILELCIAIALISTVAYFVFVGAVKSFAMIMIVCSVLTAIITLFFTHQLNKSYTALNPANGKKVNFTREETTNEIE